MTTEEYRVAAAARYDELQALNKLNDFYDYEVEFVKIWQGLGHEVLERTLVAFLQTSVRKKTH